MENRIKNKYYYTPELSEIRPGLECVHTTLNQGFIEQGGFLEPQNHWEDDLYVGELDVSDIRALFEYFGIDAVDNIRVKYLDQNDLEEIGFKRYKNQEVWEISIPADKYHKHRSLRITLDPESKILWNLSYQCEDWEACYDLDSIEIWNKTELKELLYKLYKI